MKIHPTAVVDPTARLGADVVVGPWCVLENDTEVGSGCVLESHVVIKRGTRLGADNHVFEGAVLGGLPQHLRMPEQIGGLVVGTGNTIREHVTMHRALRGGTNTRVGDANLMMVGAHVAHDCVVGSSTILANNVMLAGHVIVEDRAYLSGGVAVHQFCRVGRLAMVGGLARVVQDVPPFVMVDGGSNDVVGLNSVGLRRAGFTVEQIATLKAAYRVIYRSGLPWSDVLATLRREFNSGPVACYAEFLAGVQRGIVQDRRMPPGATIKLRTEDGGDAAAEATPAAAVRRAKAG